MKQKYAEFLQFTCDFCGAKRGQPCLSMNQARGMAIECYPHVSRYDKLRAKNDRQIKKEQTLLKEQVNAVQRWLKDS